jgi:signal transduction histidine kinase/CheY-like chemotaxis protein
MRRALKSFGPLLLALSLASCQGDGRAPHSLDGLWRFQPGDDPSWSAPELDDRAWLQIESGRSWGRQGYRDVERAWYRREVELPEGYRDGRPLGLFIGPVSSAYELYVDGVALGGAGKLPPDGRLEYDRSRTYALPPAVVVDGRVVIALRVWRSPVEGTLFGGFQRAMPSIGPLIDLLEDSRRLDLAALVLAWVFMLAGIYHLLLYRHHPTTRDYLWLGLVFVNQGLFTFISSPWRYAVTDDFTVLKEIEYLSRYLMPALFIQFLWTFLGRPIGRWLRLYQLSHVVLAVVVVATPGLLLNLRTVRWWELWSAPLIVGSLVLIFRRAWQGDRGARVIGAGALLLGLTLFHDIWIGQRGIAGVFLGAYGFAIFLASMVVALANRFARVHNELDELRRDLESRVALRTCELAEARDAAEAASRAKSEFLANMSHEIRTPMTGILGVADLVLASHLTSAQRQLIETLQGSATGLLQVIDDVLDFSKIEAGRMRIVPQSVDLHRLLFGVFDLLEPRASAKKLELRLNIGDAVPAWVRCDPVRLRQVLINLVNNAIKFTLEGRVELSVDHARVDGEEGLRCEVRDTGIGIEADDLPRLFRAFTQADGASARRFEGTGLGLAISRRLAEQMGGTLEVDSTPGHGSVFTFTVRAPAVAAETAPVTAQLATSRMGRILLAEDNPVNQMVLVGYLESFGHQVELAVNGQEALDRIAAEPFDLVMMDCQMPELDGYEATRRVRRREAEQEPPRRRLPIVAVTAHAFPGERERCLEAGMDDYLVKPFRPDELAALLARWLDG